jgi:hypothetical protein
VCRDDLGRGPAAGPGGDRFRARVRRIADCDGGRVRAAIDGQHFLRSVAPIRVLVLAVNIGIVIYLWTGKELFEPT